MSNIIPFPNSNNKQLQTVYTNHYATLHTMLDGQPEAQALLARLNETTVEMFRHATATIDMITAMQVTTTRQRNDLIEELNHIERDLMNGTATHPLTQQWLEQMTERNHAQVMQSFINKIADNLEIADFDALTWLNILAGQDKIALDEETIEWQIQLMQHVGQRAGAAS